MKEIDRLAESGNFSVSRYKLFTPIVIPEKQIIQDTGRSEESVPPSPTDQGGIPAYSIPPPERVVMRSVAPPPTQSAHSYSLLRQVDEALIHPGRGSAPPQGRRARSVAASSRR